MVIIYQGDFVFSSHKHVNKNNYLTTNTIITDIDDLEKKHWQALLTNERIGTRKTDNFNSDE